MRASTEGRAGSRWTASCAAPWIGRRPLPAKVSSRERPHHAGQRQRAKRAKRGCCQAGNDPMYLLRDWGRQGQSRPSRRAGTEMLAMAAPDDSRLFRRSTDARICRNEDVAESYSNAFTRVPSSVTATAGSGLVVRVGAIPAPIRHFRNHHPLCESRTQISHFCAVPVGQPCMACLAYALVRGPRGWVSVITTSTMGPYIMPRQRSRDISARAKSGPTRNRSALNTHVTIYSWSIRVLYNRSGHCTDRRS